MHVNAVCCKNRDIKPFSVLPRTSIELRSGTLTWKRGPILFRSRYDWILDCCGDAMKKLLPLWRRWWGGGELLTRWNHEVSRCHSSFRRRLGVRDNTAVGLRAGGSVPGSFCRTQPGTIPNPPPLTDGGACSPMKARVWAALWQRFQLFRSLAASGGGGEVEVGGVGATPIPNPCPPERGAKTPKPSLCTRTARDYPRAGCSPLQRVKSLFIHYFSLFVSSAAGKRQCALSRNDIQGVGKRTGLLR